MAILGIAAASFGIAEQEPSPPVAPSYCIQSEASTLEPATLLRAMRQRPDLKSVPLRTTCEAGDIIVAAGRFTGTIHWILRVHRQGEDLSLFRAEVGAYNDKRAPRRLAAAFARYLRHEPRQSTTPGTWKVALIDPRTGQEDPHPSILRFERFAIVLESGNGAVRKFPLDSILDAEVIKGAGAGISGDEVVVDDARGMMITLPLGLAANTIGKLFARKGGRYFEICYSNTAPEEELVMRVVSGGAKKLQEAFAATLP